MKNEKYFLKNSGTTLKKVGLLFTIIFSLFISSCKVTYSFRDVTIDYTKYKTIKINYIDNKARYVNPQLSPQLTNKIQQKIASQTKLIRTASDDAHLQVSGYVSDYTVSTSAITTSQATANRLTVGVHIVVKDDVANKTNEFDVSRSFDFDAKLSLQQAEVQLQDEILRNLTDEIFNHIFSNN
jgi:hypothetical protein